MPFYSLFNCCWPLAGLIHFSSVSRELERAAGAACRPVSATDLDSDRGTVVHYLFRAFCRAFREPHQVASTFVVVFAEQSYRCSQSAPIRYDNDRAVRHPGAMAITLCPLDWANTAGPAMVHHSSSGDAHQHALNIVNRFIRSFFSSHFNSQRENKAKRRVLFWGESLSMCCSALGNVFFMRPVLSSSIRSPTTRPAPYAVRLVVR